MFAFQAAALALALTLSACGGSAASPSSAAGASPAASGSAASSAGPQNLDQLYAAAKSEGQVTIFAPTPDEIMAKMVDAFSQKYPGVKVNITDITAGQTVERIVTESATGKVSVDASQASLDTIEPLVQRQLLATVDWSKFTDGAPQNLVAVNGQGVAYYHLPNLLAYNTKLLKDSDLPTQWEDLTKPQWKGGKMLLDNRGHFIDHMGFQWGEDKLLQYARDLKAQQPLFIPRMVDGANRLAAGEAALATVSMNDLVRFQAKGAPMQIVPVQPINASAFVVYVLKNAPHPNAARLWTAWAVSKEGRALFEKVGEYALATPGSGSHLEQLLSSAHVSVWTPSSPEEAAQEGKYQKGVQDIFTK
jgi:iron(III) transport system substrate-binding protein